MLQVEILTEDDDHPYAFKCALEEELAGQTIGNVTIEAVDVYVQEETP